MREFKGVIEELESKKTVKTEGEKWVLDYFRVMDDMRKQQDIRKRKEFMSIDPKYDLPKSTSDRNTPIDYGDNRKMVPPDRKVYSSKSPDFNSMNRVKGNHIPGAKEDQGKPDLDLVLGDFGDALMEVGKVGTFGAAKYSRSGWLRVPEGNRRYRSALWRHLIISKSEQIDPESGLSHLAHAAWNALATLQLYLKNEV